MPGKYYMLVNPYVEGNASVIFNANNSLEAAKSAYESISKYFNNSVNNFKFTLLKLKSDAVNKKVSNDRLNLASYGGTRDNKYYNPENFSHFVVNEKMGKNDKNGQISFNIQKFGGSTQNLDLLIENVLKIQKEHSSPAHKSKRSKKSESDKSSENSKSDTDSDTEDDEENDDDDDNEDEDSTEDSEQKGGGRHSRHSKRSKSKYSNEDDEDDSSSSDDDDSPNYRSNRRNPISYFYYNPALYPLDKIFMPTFISPLSFPFVVDFGPQVIYGSMY